MLLQQVLNTIIKNKLIDYGEGIVVGISGGYDSVCLLHILYSISSELNIKIFPVHINHMLRGDESLRDENFVREFCSSLGLEAYVKKIDIAQKAKDYKVSIEEAGRDARYEEFQKVAIANGASKIAVAHSKNDQVETILMRIFRGTGLEGLRGMEYQRDNIIRPLLDTDRSQIEKYVNENGLKAIIDSSNLHTDYLRNRVRLNVIPEINSSMGFDITENILRLSKIVVTDDDFLRYNSELYYKKAIIYKGDFYVEMDCQVLLHMHQAMRSRVLRNAISDVCNTLNGIGLVHIDSIISLLEKGQTGARVDLPQGINVVKSYTSLIIKKQQEIKSENFEYVLNLPSNTFLSLDTKVKEVDAVLKTETFYFEQRKDRDEFIKRSENVYTKFIDLQKVKQKNADIIIRNRRNGDIFKPKNSIGTKKLKEYFIDNKIPRENRDRIPLIAIGKEIIWIVGNKISDNYKVTENTNSVLRITFTYNKTY